MSTLRVELADLKPGVRYSFEQNDDPDIIIVEGTFDSVIPPICGLWTRSIFVYKSCKVFP